MQNTISNKKRLKGILVMALCAFVCLGGVSLPAKQAHAWFGIGGGGKTDPETEALQKRNVQVHNLLEKARAEREKHNYRAARSHGQKALRLNPDSEAAIAFVEYLDTAESDWNEYQQLLRDKKEAEKAARSADRDAAREAKRTMKERERAARLAEKEEARAAALAEKETARREPGKVEEPVAIVEGEEKEITEEAAEPLDAEMDAAGPDPARTPREREADPEGFTRPAQAIVVDGDKVEYFEERGVIVAEGNVSIEYGDVTLKCDKIEIDTKERTALCEGNVEITHPDGVLTGDRIRYDLAREEGEVIGGEVTAFPWFGRARETGKVGPNEYVLYDGYITTCDHDKPHYHLKAGEIRVFPDDKVIAKNVVYYIGKVPVLWVPYYYHPIIDTKAKVQFIPGVTSDWGYFLLSAWRHHIKGNTKIDGLLDYRTKKGFAGGANLYYDMADFGFEALGRGLFRTYFIAQNDIGTYDPTAFRDDEGTEARWRSRYQWKHRVDFDEDTVGMLEFNKTSDRYVLKDYFYNEYEENDPIPPNYISIISSKPNYVFSVEANKRFDDYYTVVQRLPEVKIEVFDQRLWETPLYYSSETSATYFDKEYEFSTSPSEKVGRFDTFQKLSYATGIGPVSIVPYATLQETVYTRTRDSASAALRSVFGGGVDSFIRLHRVFDISTDAFGLDINGLRHIMVPKVEYYYTYRPSISRNALYEMDSIDTIENQNGFRTSFENKLQTKRGGGDEKVSVELVRSILYSDYSIREKEGGPRFRRVGMELELRPYDWFYLDNRLEVEGENWSVKTSSIEGVITPWDNFQAAVGYRYEKRPRDPRNQITLDMSWIINPKWRLGLYERFDIHKTEFEEHQLSITRDLHCWEVEATYTVKGNSIFKDNFTFWLALRLKAFPDLPIGLSRAYEKRAPGSTLASPHDDVTVPITR